MTPTEKSVVHRVLLVDDDEAVRTMMNATLERKGFDVVNAASVSEALRCIATENFDVLITDLHMPNPVMVLRWLQRCGTLNQTHSPCWSAVTQTCRVPWPLSFWKRTKSS